MDTSTLFSNLEPQYGIATAPQEQAASDTGNEEGPSGQPAGTPPMTNMINAIMRGAARVQGQEQAKGVAKKQAANVDKRQITFKPNPDDPGNPRVTLKDFTADALNGTEGSDLKEAHDRPARQVEAKIAAGSQQQPTPAAAPPPDAAPPHPTDIVDQTLGFHVPRGADADIAEKLKTPEGIRQLNYELGGTEEHARITINALKKGKITPGEVHDRVAIYRERKYAQIHQEIQAPIDAAQRIADRQQAARDRDVNEQRLLRTQSDAEMAAANKEKLDYLRGTDTSILPSDPQQFLVAIHSATNAPWSAADDQRALLKRQQDVHKAFLDYTDTRKDIFALGNQPTWEAAKAAFGHDVTPDDDRIGRARWQAARAYTLRKSQDEDMKRQHADDQHEMTMLRMANASKEKPEHLGRADLNLMDTSELLGIDPSTVKNYDRALEAKEGLLRKEIADHTEKRDDAAVQAKAILQKPPEKQQFGDPEQLAHLKHDQQAAHARVTAATAELQQIQAARVARRGGKTGGTVQPVAPPAALPRPVANGRYETKVENGIAAYMQTHGIGRSKAIQALRAAGKIQ